MAVVTVQIYEGRSADVKRRLHAGIAEVMIRELEAKPEQIRVIIQEVKKGDYSVGGKPV